MPLVGKVLTKIVVQTRAEDTVVVRVPIPKEVLKKNLDIVFGANHLKIAYRVSVCFFFFFFSSLAAHLSAF